MGARLHTPPWHTLPSSTLPWAEQFIPLVPVWIDGSRSPTSLGLCRSKSVRGVPCLLLLRAALAITVPLGQNASSERRSSLVPYHIGHAAAIALRRAAGPRRAVAWLGKAACLTSTAPAPVQPSDPIWQFDDPSFLPRKKIPLNFAA